MPRYIDRETLLQALDAREHAKGRWGKMTHDRCIVCGDIIPEGRQICWMCESTGNLDAYAECEKCEEADDES